MAGTWGIHFFFLPEWASGENDVKNDDDDVSELFKVKVIFLHKSVCRALLWMRPTTEVSETFLSFDLKLKVQLVTADKEGDKNDDAYVLEL